jgi:hypothetical protein
MLLGLMKSLISPMTLLILYLFLMAYAMIFLGFSWEIMCLLSCSTSWEGVETESMSVLIS